MRRRVQPSSRTLASSALARGLGKWAYDTDVNGAPTIVVSKTGECTAIVEDTKPLTYGVELGAVEEKENDLFAGLKDLAGLLGATLARPRSTRGRPTPSARSDSFDELARATSSLARSLVALGDLRADVVVALNAGELSDTGELTPVDWGSAALDAACWHDQFAWLRTRRQQAIDSLEERRQQVRSRRFSTRRRMCSITGKTSRKPSPPLRRRATAGTSSSSAHAC